MAPYDLPTSVTIGGAELAIRSDYRAALDVMEVLSDAELTDRERGELALEVFYPDRGAIVPRDEREAGERMMWFLSGGDGSHKAGGPRPRVMDWAQDFPLVVAPVNRVLGFEVRSRPDVHWWTFLSAYYEVGDCLFAQVVAIRKKKREGRKLDKQERRFYDENRALVDLRKAERAEETELFGQWIGA